MIGGYQHKNIFQITKESLDYEENLFHLPFRHCRPPDATLGGETEAGTHREGHGRLSIHVFQRPDARAVHGHQLRWLHVYGGEQWGANHQWRQHRRAARHTRPPHLSRAKRKVLHRHDRPAHLRQAERHPHYAVGAAQRVWLGQQPGVGTDGKRRPHPLDAPRGAHRPAVPRALRRDRLRMGATDHLGSCSGQTDGLLHHTAARGRQHEALLQLRGRGIYHIGD